MDSVRAKTLHPDDISLCYFFSHQSSSKQPRGALLVSNLPSLQNLLKRDPTAYRDEFLLQWNAFLSLTQLVKLNLDTTSAKARETEQKWRELVSFVAQTASCYKDVTKDFPNMLKECLLEGQGLGPETRKTLIQSLVLLRNRDMMPSLEYALAFQGKKKSF